MTAIIGIDLGSKRVGCAVATAGVATPVAALDRKGDDAEDAAAIRGIADERGAGTVVLGHPRRLDGTTGPAAEEAERFAGALRAVGLDVVLWDERLTTVEVERSMIAGGARRARRRRSIDAAAATVILQSYIDTVGWPS
ncbi:MAG: Holliday junction resolvase RuvX [Actinomycetota bacterium]